MIRLILIAAVVLLAIDALYYDGAHTQAGQREISAAVTALTAGMGVEGDRPAERNAAPLEPEDGTGTGR